MERMYQARMEQTPRTLYDQTQLDYTYMEYLLDHHESLGLDLSKFKGEIESFREKCKVWVTLYEESIYKQFATLLETLLSRIQDQTIEFI
jgi:hypothetical protein